MRSGLCRCGHAFTFHAHHRDGTDCSSRWCRCARFESTRGPLVRAWVATVAGIGLWVLLVFTDPPLWTYYVLVLVLMGYAWDAHGQAAKGAAREYQQTRRDAR